MSCALELLLEAGVCLELLQDGLELFLLHQVSLGLL